MPKPFFLRRPAGLYVRFLVPLDLRSRVGSRYLVRPLHAPRDGAALVAAYMALALSRAFAYVRQGHMVDFKKLLESAQAAGRKELTIKGLTLPNGTVFESVEIADARDADLFRVALEDIGRFTVTQQAVLAPPAPKGLPLSEAIKAHLEDLTIAGRDGKTILESRHTLRLLVGLVGDIAVQDITLDHMRLFFRDVVYWPKNASRMPKNKDRSVRTIIDEAKKAGGSEPAAHTLNKYRQRLAVFFNSAKAAKLITSSPLEGLPARKAADGEGDTGRAFTTDELQRIFDAKHYVEWASKYPHRWWGPMLGLYTGARVNEIGQLYVADVETVDGIPGLHFNKRFPGQKIKTRSSVRFVPLAPALLKAGFLTYVEDVKRAGHDRLFPHLPNATGLGYGKQLSKQFSAYIKGLGIDEAGVGFHAFRHTLATMLDRAGVPEKRIARITGHSAANTVLSKFYIDPSTLKERLETLRAFKPCVTHPRYRAEQLNLSLTAVLFHSRNLVRRRGEP